MSFLVSIKSVLKGNCRVFALSLAVALCLSSVQAQEIVHPRLGTSVTSPGGLKLTLVDRRQNWNMSEKETFTSTIVSPKSVNIHPNGSKFYVNSLEGATTVAFDADTRRVLSTVRHSFDASHASLWAPESGYYPFRHYTRNLNTFSGRPVESAFSHGGRYLWVPYYRRSFDINAQDPSALCVIDTRNDSIVRIMEAGVLPKMIAVSPDNKRVAVAHWGDNTIGYIDISSSNPQDWRHLKPFVVDQQIKWNLSLTERVDRDNGSGNALRGTAFSPDGRYLLVACMGGSGGIAVIDTQEDGGKYLGKLYGMMANVRHLIFSNNDLYLSINRAGYVQRLSHQLLYSAIDALRKSANQRYTISEGWENAKVGAGARTIVASPKGRFIFVACNFSSSLDVVDTSTMKRLISLPLDSYPVGMDISADGTTVYVTSQGRKGKVPSGNCVDIVKVEY